jgi:hypothetical protein
LFVGDKVLCNIGVRLHHLSAPKTLQQCKVADPNELLRKPGNLEEKDVPGAKPLSRIAPNLFVESCRMRRIQNRQLANEFRTN